MKLVAKPAFVEPRLDRVDAMCHDQRRSVTLLDDEVSHRQLK
jgi:hypothetical protein